ncbi:hypothetical protein Tco_0831073, partial [Tanacetum coccineum]
MSKVLQERGFGSLPSSTETNPRDQVKSISTTIEADSYLIRRIGSSQYAVSTRQNKSRQKTVPFPSRLDNHYCECEEENYGPKFTKAYGASHINNTIPQKEKDPGRASISVMPLLTYLNLRLGELAHTKLTVELADRTVKYPKGIAENVLVGIGMDSANITRKRSKPDKHGHGKGKSEQDRGILYKKCMPTRNSYFSNNSNVTIPRRRNKGRAPNIVEPELRTIVAPMAECTMEELLQAPTEGYEEAIVLPEINADHFEIKMNLLQLVQANPFHGLENENPHAHINSFKRITLTLRFRNVPNDAIKLMMFPYSLEGAAKTWESDSKTDERIDKLADQLSTLVEIVSKKVVTPAPVKAVEET